MIRKVVLRRFKRFEEESFDLDGPVILAGPNNCGKTTVLQAITAWSQALVHWQKLNDFRKHGGAYTKAPLSRLAFNSVPLPSFDLLWRDRKYSGTVEIEVHTDQAQPFVVEFIADSTEQIFVRPKAQVPADVAQKFNLDVVYVATVAGLSVEEPIHHPDYITTLLGRQKPGDVIRNLLLNASKGNAWSRLTAAVQRLFGVELLVPTTPGGVIQCEYREKAGGPSFDLLSAGSGFRQVIALLATLFTRQGSVVLVDEPDAHLHVFLQDTIFAELKKAAGETKSQLILATHSEVIFNSASPEQICVVMGKPRRLASGEEVAKLRKAMGVLEQSDLIAALSAPGVLYLEGFTDLNLLREWATALDHPLRDYLNRTPFWRAKKPPGRDDASEVPPKDHYEALRLVKADMNAVWLLDSDGKPVADSTAIPQQGRLNRSLWARYEAESYLLHPASLARFIDSNVGGGGGLDAVRTVLVRAFEVEAGAGLGAQIFENFLQQPLQPPQIVERYLRATKARTEIIGAILQEGGIHDMDYTRYGEIAAQMMPEEIHPEVVEKLDFIRQAFAL